MSVSSLSSNLSIVFGKKEQAFNFTKPVCALFIAVCVPVLEESLQPSCSPERVDLCEDEKLQQLKERGGYS